MTSTPESVCRHRNENENFVIGNQWEGVESNGQPTPVFNFLKRVTLFQVASVTTDNIKMQASPLATAADKMTRQIAELVNREFGSLFEHNKIGSLLREYMRNAAVDGDGCTYTYFDADIKTGQAQPGAIVTEIIDNTRVLFGNPNDRRVQKQPYIIIKTREIVDDVRDRAKENGAKDWDKITPDSASADDSAMYNLTDDKVTVLLKLYRDKKDGLIHAVETTKDCIVRKDWSLGIRLYPITWLELGLRKDCYHGQAMITGLIPNQKYVNKLFAMIAISLSSTAFPKIAYDGTRIKQWDNRPGTALKINGGDINTVAKIIEPAPISPQIEQFIRTTVEYTQTFLGATSAAMGDTRPDNTSAIIALQRAASIPSEITKQNLYQSIEDLGRIYMEFMGEYYGTRDVNIMPEIPPDLPVPPPNEPVTTSFDFSVLKDIPMSLKLDVGASAYWSEIASMQTLDNLLMQGKIDLIDYLERIPDGYISMRQELINKMKSQQAQIMQAQRQGPQADENGELIDTGQLPEIPTGGGYAALQRKVNETGVVE